MMGVDIWFNVTITDGPHNWVENLPDFDLINGQKWEASCSYETIEGATSPPYYTSQEIPGEYNCNGEGRYDDETNIIEWAVAFTAAHEGCTVEVSTEWHADGYGEELNVYRNGERVVEECKVNAMIAEEVPAPSVIAQKVLDNHVIHDHWVRTGEQIRALLIEAVELDRTHTRGS